jgi:hypothetical protein
MRSDPDSPEPKPAGLDRVNVILLSFVSFVMILFTVWVVSGSKRYRREYADATQGWRVGTSRVVELTVVEQDKSNLGCASDKAIGDLRCGYAADRKPAESLSADRHEVLQPFNTVAGELLLGAGLWASPDLKQSLPASRFSVVCNYNIKGVVRSARIRFDPTGRFEPLSRTITAGTLTECMVPR